MNRLYLLLLSWYYRVSFLLWKLHNKYECDCRWCVMWRFDPKVSKSEDMMDNRVDGFYDKT